MNIVKKRIPEKRDRLVLQGSPNVIPTPPRLGDRIGYARVSTDEQNLDLQIDALKKAGCINIYQEKVSASGAKRRPQLDLAIKELRPGDTLYVWRLDRLARSMGEFHRRMEAINGAKASFRSLTETFDFDTEMGQFVVLVLAAVAQLERQITIRRTKAGLAAARDRGQILGAATKVDDTMKRQLQQLAARKGKERMTLQAIANQCGIALSTIFSVFPGGRTTILKWRGGKKSNRN